MKLQTTHIFIILILLAVGFRLMKRLEDPPSSLQPQAPAEAPALPGPAEESAAPPPIAPDTTPATPLPRSEESRAAEMRNFENPLIQPDPPDTPPLRRAANADPEVAADFDQIYLMLRNFRNLTGGNPIGTNAEMMKSIMGDNPKGAQLGPPEGQSLNQNGELIDHWGSPYFFHQLTRDLMEIRSAGPDRQMWNEDDIISD